MLCHTYSDSEAACIDDRFAPFRIVSEGTIRSIPDSMSMGAKTYRDARGYLRFKDSGKLVHRWKAEKMLGRKLRPGEVVHHKNKSKRDNRYSNLEVFPSRKSHFAKHVEDAWWKTKRHRTRRKW